MWRLRDTFVVQGMAYIGLRSNPWVHELCLVGFFAITLIGTCVFDACAERKSGSLDGSLEPGPCARNTVEYRYVFEGVLSSKLHSCFQVLDLFRLVQDVGLPQVKLAYSTAASMQEPLAVASFGGFAAEVSNATANTSSYRTQYSS